MDLFDSYDEEDVTEDYTEFRFESIQHSTNKAQLFRFKKYDKWIPNSVCYVEGDYVYVRNWYVEKENM